MPQGLFVNGRRPESKKAVKEAVADLSANVVEVEATSMFGNEFQGDLTVWEGGGTIYFVGPDPYTSRKFYGQLVRKADGKVVVK